MELKFDRDKNIQERLWFIHHYSSWVKSVSNKIWSQQQANFINSLFINSKNCSLSPSEYLKMIDAGRKARKNHFS